jgi:hypothetical protein
MKNTNPHIGSSFDDFLEEENLLTQVNEMAIEKVIAWQLQQEIVVIKQSIDSAKKSK